mmetsp:Transcript_25401/g.59102  ORF Transcript_25401/g.59102 Transcript_25401/m.59102 type:complete len:969 (+) Transcript_25401:37-2943(+)
MRSSSFRFSLGLVLANAGLVAFGQDQATLCAEQPGYAPGEYLAGRKGEQYLIANPGEGSAYPAWNGSTPVTIIHGCPVKFFLIWGDEVHLRVTKHNFGSGLQLDWEFDVQRLAFANPVFLFGWEKHMPIYGEHGGMYPIQWGTDCVFCDLIYDPYREQTGSYLLPYDDVVERHDEPRHDFYHILDWVTRYTSNGASWYGDEEHAGEVDGQLRFLIFAREEVWLQDPVEEENTIYKGTVDWRETVGEGTMRQDQYDLLKQFYRDGCSGRRGDAQWDQPWEVQWTRQNYMDTVSRNPDDIPYCTWLKATGWNESYWSQHLDTTSGTCNMIEGVRCADGYITEIFLDTKGIKGKVDTLLKGVLSHVTYISFTFNQLTGTLPAELVTSTVLADFSVWHNQLEGELPCLTMPSLFHVDLSYNYFSGQLPSCYMTEDKEFLFLEHNSFSGSIPPEIGQMSSVMQIYLRYNQLTGTIPTEICNLHVLYDLDLDGNFLEGSIPDACLNNPDDSSGWADLRYLWLSHNRLRGSLPTISRHRGLWWGCFPSDDRDPYYWYYYHCFFGDINLQNNFFDGTIDTQFDDLIDIMQQTKGVINLRFRNNQLSGPLPPKLEAWSLRQGVHYIRYDLQDNYFRCEKDGRWPDWVNRFGDDISEVDDTWLWHQWGPRAALGKCLPIAQPTGVSPAEVTTGQSGQISVSGKNFVTRGRQRCRYTAASGGAMQDVVATRISDNLIRCLLPVTLTEGTYRITVSNFADEWASADLLDDFNSLPEVEVTAPVVPDGATALSVTMQLGGVSAADFLPDSFRSGIASLLDISPSLVIIRSFGRRLQATTGLSVQFVVDTTGTNLGLAMATDKLQDEAEVMTKLGSAGLPVTSVTTETSFLRSTTNVTEETTDKLPIVWIIVAAAAFVVSMCLCGFIFFLYRREKQGMSYFKEELNDEPPAPSTSAAPGVVIGNADGGNEDNNMPDAMAFEA